MSGIHIFQKSFKYLTNHVRYTIENLNHSKLLRIFEILIQTRKDQENGQAKMIMVDGQGRSLQSLLLTEDCLEHNGFNIILPVSNANLRPWQPGDVFIFNTGSGSGSPLAHARAAKKIGLQVFGMSYNPEMEKEFENVLILRRNENRNKQLAPLGTEFEISSAIIGVCLAYSVKDTPEESLIEFNKSTEKILKLYDATYDYLEEEVESIMSFINLVSKYIPASNRKKVYFLGVGRNEIINRIAAIRYGHLHKDPDSDLTVIYEGHWDLRQRGDLAIILSGSGATSQTLTFANQAFISGMHIFGVTSFHESDLAQFTRRVDGCLVLPGREDFVSMYNQPVHRRHNYFPAFELNCYITFDALLAQIAYNFDIAEVDMKASHRPKVLE
ncbi:MAG: hypothetical protein K9W44_05045 [Candidatus Lokiarchaeota archaeon]|nr:hypothetical protein [Candidatus Harpocratesius repetitus]